MAYANLTQFITKVKKGNRLFKLKNSSLNALITELNATPTLDSLRPLYAGIPANKKLKYDKALALLRTDFPGVDTAAPTTTTTVKPPTGGIQLLPSTPPVKTKVIDINALDYNVHAPLDPTSFGLTPVTLLGSASHVKTDGYTIIEDPDNTGLLTSGAVPEFGTVQIGRINEAFGRVRTGVDKSFSSLLTVGPTVSPTHPYRRFFGAYNLTRLQTVRKNYQTMRLVLDGQRGSTRGSLFIVDARNFNNDFRDVFAFTYPNMYTNKGYVVVWIGRAFFSSVGSGKGFYDKSSDETLGTLVHELTHACFGSVDVPPSGSGWSLNTHGVPVDSFGNYGDEFNIPPQVSTETDDESLAQTNPADAIRNADNYGQFTRAVLALTGE